MNKKRYQKMIELIQAQIDGKQIQYLDDEKECWFDIKEPQFDFDKHLYRIKPELELRRIFKEGDIVVREWKCDGRNLSMEKEQVNTNASTWYYENEGDYVKLDDTLMFYNVLYKIDKTTWWEMSSKRVTKEQAFESPYIIDVKPIYQLGAFLVKSICNEDETQEEEDV